MISAQQLIPFSKGRSEEQHVLAHRGKERRANDFSMTFEKSGRDRCGTKETEKEAFGYRFGSRSHTFYDRWTRAQNGINEGES